MFTGRCVVVRLAAKEDRVRVVGRPRPASRSQSLKGPHCADCLDRSAVARCLLNSSVVAYLRTIN